jgi:hypothetical protein
MNNNTMNNNINEQSILALIHRQLDTLNSTIPLITQSYSVIQSQQNNIENLLNMLGNSTLSSTQMNPPTITVPISYEFSLYDLSNNEMVSPLLQNIMSVLNNSIEDGLSVEDISNSTHLTRYSYVTQRRINDTCPISLDVFRDDDEVRRIIRCGHYFKKTSLDTWLSMSPYCPICRCNLRENTTSAL